MPLDPKLQKYTTASPILTVFNFTDIAEGTGIVVFQGFSHKEDTTLSYGISNNSMFSEEEKTSASTVGSSSTKILDLDFDLSQFNLPKTIKGTCDIVATLGAETGSSDDGATTYLIIKIRKWDGSTETEIANGKSSTLTIPANTETYDTVHFQITIPLTIFGKGDVLRATAELWAQKTGSNARIISLFHDPMNTDTPTTADTSNLQINIPFDLGL